MLRVITLPLMLLRMVLRVIGRGLKILLGPMLARVDESDKLSDLINTLSSSMATQRGLLVMIGTGVVLSSLIAHGLILIIMVTTSDFGRYLYWLCIPFTMLHIGVLIGFVGIMLAVPLGQGYRSQRE
ncbi:MAG: hypothetical protein K8S97_15120 [Anaerolineae bacterium]|nr:hypothetical protein [Anaerolineae bacterium]